MMGKIFGNAQTTLACIGESHDGDNLLHQVAAQLSTLPSVQSEGDYIRWQSAPPWLAQWINEQSEEFMGRVLSAISEFFLRPYFHRLWIIQELYAGYRRQVRVLCGPLVFGWHSIIEFSWIHNHIARSPWISPFPTLNTDSLDQDHTYALMETLLDPPASFRSPAISHIWSSQFECADPRDQVYGLLGLLNQDAGCEVVPDYEKSEVDVAIDVAASLNDLDSLFSVAAALQISRSTPTITSLLQGHTHNTHENIPKKWRSRVLEILHVKSGPQGRLVSHARRGPKGFLSATDFSDDDWTPIFAEDEVALMAPAGTRCGDLIVESFSIPCIVRKQDDGRLKLVGRAFFVKGFGATEPPPCPCQKETSLPFCLGGTPHCSKERELWIDLSIAEAICLILTVWHPGREVDLWSKLAGRSVEFKELNTLQEIDD